MKPWWKSDSRPGFFQEFTVETGASDMEYLSATAWARYPLFRQIQALINQRGQMAFTQGGKHLSANSNDPRGCHLMRFLMKG
jgi:hypothetical protein